MTTLGGGGIIFEFRFEHVLDEVLRAASVPENDAEVFRQAISRRMRDNWELDPGRSFDDDELREALSELLQSIVVRREGIVGEELLTVDGVSEFLSGLCNHKLRPPYPICPARG